MSIYTEEAERRSKEVVAKCCEVCGRGASKCPFDKACSCWFCDNPNRHPSCRTCPDCLSSNPADCIGTGEGEDRCSHCGALCGHSSKCYECGKPKRMPKAETAPRPRIVIECGTCVYVGCPECKQPFASPGAVYPKRLIHLEGCSAPKMELVRLEITSQDQRDYHTLRGHKVYQIGSKDGHSKPYKQTPSPYLPRKMKGIK